MFRTRNPEPPTDDRPTAGQLPEGYDDPGSPFYVPDHLVEPWSRFAEGADMANLRGVVRAIAEHRAWKRARPELFQLDRERKRMTFMENGQVIWAPSELAVQAPHLLADAVDMARRNASLMFALTQEGNRETQAVLNAEWDSLVPEAEHAIRLHETTVQHEAERRVQAQAFQLERRNLCPVCGVSSIETGAPAHREVVPSPKGFGFGARTITLMSCAGCYLAAVRYFTEQLALAPVGDFAKTRLQHVAAHFEQKGL